MIAYCRKCWKDINSLYLDSRGVCGTCNMDILEERPDFTRNSKIDWLEKAEKACDDAWEKSKP